MKSTALRILPSAILILNLLAPSVVQAQELALKIKVVTEQANIRRQPDISSEILHQVPMGTILNSTGRDGDWFRVVWETEEQEFIIGFVHESLIVVVERRAEESRPEEVQRPPVQTPVTVKPPVSTAEPPPKPAAISVTQLPEEEPVPTSSHFSISLFGGGAVMRPGDIVRGAKGVGAYYEDHIGTAGDRKVAALNAAYLFGAEISVALSPRFWVGVGGESLRGQKETAVTYTRLQTTDVYTTRPVVQALPVRLFIAYHLFPSVYVKVGLEYIQTKCLYRYAFESDGYWQKNEGRAEAWGLGAIGGLGVVVDLNSFFGFFVETLGRFAVIGDLEGTDVYTDSTARTLEENGYLYVYDVRVSSDRIFPFLYIRSREPSEAGVENVKRASLKLSGLVVKAGLRFRF